VRQCGPGPRQSTAGVRGRDARLECRRQEPLSHRSRRSPGGAKIDSSCARGEADWGADRRRGRRSGVAGHIPLSFPARCGRLRARLHIFLSLRVPALCRCALCAVESVGRRLCSCTSRFHTPFARSVQHSSLSLSLAHVPPALSSSTRISLSHASLALARPCNSLHCAAAPQLKLPKKSSSVSSAASRCALSVSICATLRCTCATSQHTGRTYRKWAVPCPWLPRSAIHERL
jgi:hypothetical protein